MSHSTPSPSSGLTTPEPSSTRSTVQVTNKSSRSFSSTFLQASIRPLASRMIKPKETASAGSPSLTPYDGILKACNVRQLQFGDINLYEINSRSRSTRFLFASAEYSGWKPGEMQARQAALQEPIRDPLMLDPTSSYAGEDVRFRDWATHYDGRVRRRPRYIYYFPGGGFEAPASKEHWKLCGHLAHELTQRGTPTTVYLVSYPLAPHCPASITMPMLVKLYYTLFPAVKDDLTHAKTNDSYLSIRDTQYPEIIFAGDSSGGNIALALALHVLSNDPTAPAPDSLMLISPAVDMRTTNPEIAKISKKDPILSLSNITRIHQAWCGADMREDDSRVSPTLGDLSVLVRNDVVVNGIIGTYDVLSPDANEFVEKLKKEGVLGKWLVWDKQVHCFPLTFSYGVSEGKEGVEWMKNVFCDKR